MDCIFCQIIAGKEPASFVHQDRICVAFLDIHPVNPGHVLVVPREHHESFNEYPAAQVAHMFKLAQRILGRIKKVPAIRCEGANIFLSDGYQAGQRVMHSHLHIVPRFRGDKQKVGLVHGDPGKGRRARLDELAAEIRGPTRRAAMRGL